MAHPRSMKVKEVKCEGLQAMVVQRAAENNFKSVLFAIINCPETASLAREVFNCHGVQKLCKAKEFAQHYRFSPSRRVQKLHFCEGSRN